MNILLPDSAAIVPDQDLGQTVVFEPNFDAACSCVDCILNELSEKTTLLSIMNLAHDANYYRITYLTAALTDVMT